MVKIGTLKDYRKAQKLLVAARLTITEENGELLKKTFVDGREAVSVVKLGKSWVFRYNPDFFNE